MSVFCQFGPYDLKVGTWDTEKEKFGDRVTEIFTRYAPNFRGSVLHRQVISPLDLERDFSLTHGNIFQGDMTLDQLFFMRPVPGAADYRTPVRGLYLCGACTHPGGGVMGAAGHNAAREIGRDFRKGALR
jgi:phytoene dehydrogenase-like protein